MMENPLRAGNRQDYDIKKWEYFTIFSRFSSTFSLKLRVASSESISLLYWVVTYIRPVFRTYWGFYINIAVYNHSF